MQAMTSALIEPDQKDKRRINAVRETLAEDAEDLAAFEERANEPLIGYEGILKRLKKDGRI